MSTVELEVAVYGRTFSFCLEGGPVGPADIPYAERPRTTVTADLEELLPDALNRAAVQLGYSVRPPDADDDSSYWPTRPVDAISFVDFHDGTDRATPYTHLRTVGPGGELIWGRSWREVTIADLLDASAAGVIKGDPLRPYFMPQESAGDFGVSEWQTTLDLLRQLPDWIKSLGSYGDGVTTLLGILLGARKVIRKTRTLWAQRGGGPLDVGEVIQDEELDIEQISRLLSIDADEAAELLAVVGRGPDGIFAKGIEAELARKLWRVIECALSSGLAGPGREPGVLEQATHEALQYVIAGGADDWELRAIFGRHLNPAWEQLNPRWEPPA